MHAIKVGEFGGPEVLRLEETVLPAPGPGEVLVSVKAAGVNPVDTYLRSGTYALRPELPYTPGFDGAGVVEALGEGVSRWSPGDRVFIAESRTGTYAECALCREDRIFALPDSLSFEEGAGIGIPFATAYRALFTKARAADKEAVFIHGASGGVGTAAVQLAKAAGLRVIGSAGSPRGLELVRDLGADEVVDHRRREYLSRTDLFGERGVDIVLEMAAERNLDEDLRILSTGGRIVIVGCRGTATIAPREAMMRDAVVYGMSLFRMSWEERTSVYDRLQEGLREGRLRPVVGRTFPLAEAAAAHERIMEPGACGKIVLLP